MEKCFDDARRALLFVHKYGFSSCAVLSQSIEAISCVAPPAVESNAQGQKQKAMECLGFGSCARGGAWSSWPGAGSMGRPERSQQALAISWEAHAISRAQRLPLTCVIVFNFEICICQPASPSKRHIDPPAPQFNDAVSLSIQVSNQ